jgi:hypothetical protein
VNHDEDDHESDGEAEVRRRRPKVPKPSLPRPHLPSVALPAPVRAAGSVLLVAVVFFGPHTWVASDAIADAGLFGDLPIGQLPDLDGLLGDDGDVPSDVSLDGLEVDDDRDDVPDYDRAAFMSGWTDASGSGCDTRQDLMVEAFDGAEVDGCDVVAGTGEAVSLYDNVTMTDPSEADAEHVVALADMWESGAWQWDDEARSTAAQDPTNLIAVTASSNRSKGSLGPDEWSPPAGGEAVCVYADIYVTVKATYELTVTSAQHDALVGMLDGCEDGDGAG